MRIRAVNRAGLFGSGSGLTLIKAWGLFLARYEDLQIYFLETIILYLLLTLCRRNNFAHVHIFKEVMLDCLGEKNFFKKFP